MPISDDDLSQIDLNLLVVFAALIETARVTRAAERLRSSQPAMSRSLARLRVLFDDPLLIKSGRAMVPTPRALALKGPVAAALGDIRRLFKPAGFDPVTDRRRFRVSSTGYGVLAVLAPLLVETSDALLILPHRAAKRFAEARGLVMFDAPEVFGTFDRREVWNGQSGGPVIDGNGDPVERPDGSVVDREDAALPFDRHTLVVGGEARWIELRSRGEFTSGGAETDAQVLYVQDEFRLTDTVKLLAGARLDEDRYFGTHVTPRGYAVWTPTPAVTVKGGVSTGFKVPTLRQLSPDSRVMSCRGGCMILGNPDLKPEESVNDERSAGYDTGDWGATVAIFRNDIENLIDTPRGSGVPPVGTEPGTGLPIYGPVNINEARIEGIEASGYAMLWDWGRASANWTWLDARNEMTGAVLDNRPKHVLNGKVDWFVSDEVMADTLVDVGADWQISDAISVRGGVLNLADTSTGDPDDDYAYVERGRTVFVGASARF